MRGFRLLLLSICCIGLIASATSCSSIRRALQSVEPEKQPVDDTTRQVQAAMAGGEYKKALELCSSAYEKNHQPAFRDRYVATGEQIRKIADAAYQEREFAEAGNVYNTLIESGITTQDFAGSLSFTEEYLNGQMTACSKALLEAGMTTYRDGKLEDAISIWKKALVFDHDNKDIKSMIETATTQSQNLKKLK